MEMKRSESMAKNNPDKENRELTYEEAANELEKAIALLEKGDLPL